jgi:hypothetical protein
MVEVTMRTAGGRLLLRPSEELNRRVTSVLGRALDLYPVSLHAFVFMSNHWHGLLSVLDAERLARFLCYVNGNVAKAVNDLVGWEGPVWGRRTQVVAVADDAAAEQRFRYILAHGAKEGLVASPLEWPGVSSARALALGEPILGEWRRPAMAVTDASASPVSNGPHTIDVTPLPAWAGLSAAQRHDRVQGMVAALVAENAKRAVVGAGLVLRQDPLDRVVLERTPAPLVHAAMDATMNAFLAARRSFLGGYRVAAKRLFAASVALVAGFPAGAIPPRPPATETTPVASAVSRRPVSGVGEGRPDDRREEVGAHVRASSSGKLGPARDEMGDVDIVARVGDAEEPDENGSLISGGLLGSHEETPAHRPGGAWRAEQGRRQAGRVSFSSGLDDPLPEPQRDIGNETSPEGSVVAGERIGAGVSQGGHEPLPERSGAIRVQIAATTAAPQVGELAASFRTGGHEPGEVRLRLLASDVAERHIDSGLEGTVAGPVDRHAPEYAQLGEDARAGCILRESDQEHG